MALAPQPGTSQAAPGHKVYPYLLRKLAITRSNQVWALDTTYIPMARGFVYLTAVVDAASRRVLAHKVAIRSKPPTPRRSPIEHAGSSLRLDPKSVNVEAALAVIPWLV
jgi:transposase InsO family protein